MKKRLINRKNRMVLLVAMLLAFTMLSLPVLNSFASTKGKVPSAKSVKLPAAAVDEPGAEEPAAEEPTAMEPATESPLVERPAAEVPEAEDKKVEEPAASDDSSNEAIVFNKLLRKKLLADGEDEVSAEEPPVPQEEEMTEEPAEEMAPEDIPEETPAEELAIEEPIAEENDVDEPQSAADPEDCLDSANTYDVALQPERAAEQQKEAPRELSGDDIISEDQLPYNAKLIAEILDGTNEGRTISIYASYDGDELYFGDMVTLIAVLKGYDDCIFTAQWQQSKDDATWFDMVGENNLSCSFEVTEENYMDYWRIMIHISAVEIDDELLQSAAND